MKHILLASALCIGMAPQAFAEDWTVGWSGEASLSGSKTTGNTDSTDVGLALKLAKETGPWKNKFYTTYDLGKVNGANNKNRWTIGYQLDRQLNDALYVYANADYFSDDFGPFKKGSFLGSGLGWQVAETDTMQWSLEAGAGYRSQRSRGTVLVFPATSNELAFRGGSDFSYKFNDSVSFFNNTELVWSDSDTYIWNDTGITAQIAGNLSARFNFRIDHHTTVPLGVNKTDTITRVALVYSLQ